MKDEPMNPWVTCIFEDMAVTVEFKRHHAKEACHYHISEQTDPAVTHLLFLNKEDSDVAGVEKYSVEIRNRRSQITEWEFSLYELPERKAVREFYENYAPFAVCLVKQGPTLTMDFN